MMKIAGVRAAMLLSGLLMPLWSAQVYSQNYPTKAVRIVVGFPAGGPADTMARIIGKKMSELGGQIVIIENRSGANGFLVTPSSVTCHRARCGRWR